MAWEIGDGFDFYNSNADAVWPGTIWTAAQIGLEVWRTTPAPAFGITYQVTNSINLTAT